jgi:hypothetical protein
LVGGQGQNKVIGTSSSVNFKDGSYYKMENGHYRKVVQGSEKGFGHFYQTSPDLKLTLGQKRDGVQTVEHNSSAKKDYYIDGKVRYANGSFQSINKLNLNMDAFGKDGQELLGEKTSMTEKKNSARSGNPL